MQVNQSSCLLLFHSILCFVKTWPPAETSSSFSLTRQLQKFFHFQKKTKPVVISPDRRRLEGDVAAETQNPLFNRFYMQQ